MDFHPLYSIFATYNENNAYEITYSSIPYYSLPFHKQSLMLTNMAMLAFTEGLLYVSNTSEIIDDECIYGNIRITGTGQLTIQGNIEM